MIQRDTQTLLLRAEISVELEAADYLEAAEHQKLMEEYFNEVKSRYPHAELKFKPRRSREPRAVEDTRRRGATGRLHVYE